MNTFCPEMLSRVAQQYGTPVWVYDADTICHQIDLLSQFDVVRYAQKACSNIHILSLMRKAGVLVDAVSHGEIERSFAAGYSAHENPDSIVFTADLIDNQTMDTVVTYGIMVNIGSLDMLSFVGEMAPGHRVWLRINPGFGHGHSRKTNTGGEHSKHGIWFSDLPRAIELVRHYGLELVGLHMHIGSGSDYEHLSRVCEAMVKSVCSMSCDIHAISAGGGLPVPYRNGESNIDVKQYFELWNTARCEIEKHLGHAVKLEIEPGRFLVAGSGTLVCEVHGAKETPQHRFALVDAGFNDLARPSFYGSYHRISILPQQTEASSRQEAEFVVAGPLCEAGDVFTQNEDGTIAHRLLPEPRPGDLLTFHDVGAYGASMSSNYNSRPLAPEVLLENGKSRLIRRRQTIQDLIALEVV